MSLNKRYKNLLTCALILVQLVLLFSLVGSSTTLAQGGPAFVRHVRVMESDETGLSNPAGLAFSPRGKAFYVVEARGRGQPPPAETDIVKLTPFGDRAGSARIAAAIRDPINMAFDSQRNRLLIFQSPNNMLIEVLEGPDGDLDPRTLVHHDARHFGLQNPQGMAVDPANGHLFILDAAGPRILRIEPDPDGGFDNAVISAVDLQPTGLVDVRGLAFDPTTGHLHVGNPAEQELYELSQTGQVVGTRNLSEFELRDSQGLAFAPSGDQTDDPGEMSLYLADSGIVSSGGQGRLSPQEGQMEVQSTELNAGTQSSGQIVELSFIALVAPAASAFESSLIETTDMSNTETFSPPSPDPSGLAYLPNSNTLLMCDGEVEETVDGITHFQGANVWELTLAGDVVNTANISKIDPTVVPMSNEPTGVAWNPLNGHLFFSDDGAIKVFELNPGPDGQYGTADDTWTRFDPRIVVDTGIQGSDPEGIAFDTWRYDRLFVAGGLDMEVYEFTLAGDLVHQFDVEQYGIADPESVEFNPDSGTLFVLSSRRSSQVVIETTTSGALLRTIDVAAADARNAAGLAYAPASDGSGAKRFYVVARGIDNNTDPTIIDGKMYEMTAPPPLTPDNTPPVANHDAYTGHEDTPLSVPAPGVLVNDSDADGDALTAVLLSDVSHGTLTLNGDGMFIYEPDENFFGTDTFSYLAKGGEFYSNVAMVTITINPVNDAPFFTKGDDQSVDEDAGPQTVSGWAGATSAGPTNEAGQTLTFMLTNDNNGLFATQPAIDAATGDLTYTPADDANGSTTVTVVLKDDGGTDNGGADTSAEQTFLISVNPVNDAPVASSEPASQEVQYSDAIAEVTFSATDVDSLDLLASSSWSVDGGGFTDGLPDNLALTGGGCSAGEDTNTCTWTLSGIANVPAGTYTVRVAVSDGDGGQTDADTTITVLPEDASVAFDGNNPVVVRVAEDGKKSGPFSLTVYVSETQPDQSVDGSAPGDIGLANVSMSLVPVGPGGPVEGACTRGPVSGSDYDAVLPVTCSFDGVEVNAYTAQVTVDGGYYTGGSEDVLTVYDPSLGFATGGGWFYWPDTTERTNFGFTMKYNKKGQNVKGNLLLIRHLPDGSIYRVKSNALEGLALGESPDPTFGWASFSGKSTYLEPGWPEPQGNYEFLVYVEDRDEPGTGVDRFWIEVKDKDREVVPAMSMAREATDNAVELSGGNIAVPHGEGGGGKE